MTMTHVQATGAVHALFRQELPDSMIRDMVTYSPHHSQFSWLYRDQLLTTAIRSDDDQLTTYGYKGIRVTDPLHYPVGHFIKVTHQVDALQ